jgi:spermidine/putrescine transport system substrate-binding protein
MTQRPPLSPEAAAVVQLHEQLQRASGRRGFSRRALLGGAGAVGAGAFLSACGTGGTPEAGDDSKPKAAVDKSDQDKVVHWANWSAYLDYDEDKKVYPTLKAFEEQTGIKATYSEDIEDNDSYYGKIQGQLKNGQDIGKDIIVFTDYMAARVIRQGYVQKLDKANIPNAVNLLDSLQHVDFDPERKYSLTYQSGYAGIAYNVKWFKDNGIPAPKTVTDLWNPKLKGRVEVLSEFRDTIGLIMMEQHVDISQPFTDEQYQAGLDVLKEQLDSGQIRQVKGNSYLEDLVPLDNPAAVACMAWSGDIFVANSENKKNDDDPDPFTFFLPETGGTLWSDNLLVPIGSPHKKNAEILFNYYYDPKVAAEAAAWINYITPVKGAADQIAQFDPGLVGSEYIFPTDEDLQKVKVFRTLSPEEETRYTEGFQKVLGA